MKTLETKRDYRLCHRYYYYCVVAVVIVVVVGVRTAVEECERSALK